METAVCGGVRRESSGRDRDPEPRQHLLHQRNPSVPQLHRPARRILRPRPGKIPYKLFQVKLKIKEIKRHLYIFIELG